MKQAWKRSRKWPRFLLLLCAAMLAVSHGAGATPGARNEDEAIEMAIERHPGKVLSVKPSGEFYRVRILGRNGRLRIVRIPRTATPGTHRPVHRQPRRY